MTAITCPKPTVILVRRAHLSPGQRGKPFAVSGPESLRLTHGLRAVHDGILVGVDTVLADNPRLNVRLVEGANPAAVILDSQLRIPSDARLFEHHDRVIIITTSKQPDTPAATRLRERGAEIICVEADSSGRPDLSRVLQALGNAGLRSIMVEGGARVIQSFLSENRADYVVITIGPLFLSGLSAVSQQEKWGPPRRMIGVNYEQYGDDMVIFGALSDELAADRIETTATFLTQQ